MVEIDDIEKAVRQVNQAVDRELTGKTGALIIQRMIRYARDVAVYDTGGCATESSDRGEWRTPTPWSIKP